MTLKEYITQYSTGFPTSEIASRWHSRMVSNGWDKLGEEGVEKYIAHFGKGIKAPKLRGLALMAEREGRHIMALGFWKAAHALDGGDTKTSDGKPSRTTTTAHKVVAEPFGYHPMLLTAVDRTEAERLIMEPDYVLQEKYDGERVLLKRDPTGTYTAGNKKGMVRPACVPTMICNAITAALFKLMAGVGSSFVLDGELVGTNYYVFDILELDGKSMVGKPLTLRLAIVEALLPVDKNSPVHIVQTAFGIKEKKALAKKLEKEGREGYVLKNVTALYTPGEMHKDAFKFQFRTITCCIAGDQTKGKESFEAFVLRPDGSKRNMGSVTCIGKPVPKPGDIIEVENLYTHPGPEGKFAQAVFKGVRDDADESDCREDKLRIKQ